jgi:hypothetical protein
MASTLDSQRLLVERRVACAIVRIGIGLSACIGFSGCSQVGSEPSLKQIDQCWQSHAAISPDHALRLAEDQAGRFLGQLNGDDPEKVRRIGGPFELTDYDRTQARTMRDGRPVLDVTYTLKRTSAETKFYGQAPAIMGHGGHMSFEVWVYCDNGATGSLAL